MEPHFINMGNEVTSGFVVHLLKDKAVARHVVTIVGAGLFLALPVMIFGLPFLSDDAAFHASWYSNFSKQLWAGDLYPRWLMDMNGGLGSPVFFFYPPVPYYLTSLLRPFFPNDQWGLHQLGLAASIALVGSGLTAYLWLRNLADDFAAMLGAILYMAMPYHLASDLYVRAAFAEYWAFVWIPLILYFIHRLVAGHRFAVIGVAVGWALLAMTHPPIMVTFGVFPFLYAVVLAPKGKRTGMSAQVTMAVIAGTGLAAIYLVPALTDEAFVLLARDATGYFSYANWLFFSHFSLWRDDKIVLVLLTANLIAIATCAFVINRSTAAAHKTLNRFWYAVAVVSVVMMTELSKPIWQVLPVLQKIQFPWRFNGMLSLATTGLLTMAISSWKQKAGSGVQSLRIVTLVLILPWVPMTLWKINQVYRQTNSTQADISMRQEEMEQNRDPPEYRPRWCLPTSSVNWESSVDEDLWAELMKTDIESLLRSAGHAPGHPLEPILIDGTGNARILLRKPREVVLRVDTSAPTSLIVPQFFYPYWSAHLAGETTTLDLIPSQPNGFINLKVPGGNHDVVLRFERSRSEIIGALISLCSLVILGGFGSFVWWSKARLARVSSGESEGL